MSTCAANLRRLMARSGVSLAELARRSGLDLRTVRGVLDGTKQPHPSTLNKLANGLRVPADELFLEPALLVQRWLGRGNPIVHKVVQDHPGLVESWSERDFQQLYDRLDESMKSTDVLALAEAINKRRTVHKKVSVLLESDYADILEVILDVLY